MPALSQVKQALSSFHLFHSDGGAKFDKQLRGKCFNSFNIQYSLIKKGSCYDNEVYEATFKSTKTKFVIGGILMALKY
ncbi:hypothetical protein BGI40_05780 [Snodgrassella communis]|uniref:Uncharacterized protein n=1 Tax=Snodgrassella communis TaxID=2946699 RepID=A0A837B1P1_9NEIS|nr:hypothetical protein [Snodgrassella communis]KDN14396.1 hypothetical protein SALWKB29_1485 [Snodgrassella communis]PIT06936.1 hypothetical protein BGI29_10695 [Snodgrassella communis]PIT26268.1 hypothetical protein BGI39_10195 [Snodgrassella communis]PIT29215.1 hypothetical protein BGI38_03460 [Snodgrassella communis]PIT33930.1 hypothetical protein BGI40_05780 [Snodgrassella communis]